MNFSELLQKLFEIEKEIKKLNKVTHKDKQKISQLVTKRQSYINQLKDITQQNPEYKGILNELHKDFKRNTQYLSSMKGSAVKLAEKSVSHAKAFDTQKKLFYRALNRRSNNIYQDDIYKLSEQCTEFQEARSDYIETLNEQIKENQEVFNALEKRKAYQTQAKLVDIDNVELLKQRAEETLKEYSKETEKLTAEKKLLQDRYNKLKSENLKIGYEHILDQSNKNLDDAIHKLEHKQRESVAKIEKAILEKGDPIEVIKNKGHYTDFDKARAHYQFAENHVDLNIEPIEKSESFLKKLKQKPQQNTIESKPKKLFEKVLNRSTNQPPINQSLLTELTTLSEQIGKIDRNLARYSRSIQSLNLSIQFFAKAEVNCTIISEALNSGYDITTQDTAEMSSKMWETEGDNYKILKKIEEHYKSFNTAEKELLTKIKEHLADTEKLIKDVEYFKTTEGANKHHIKLKKMHTDLLHLQELVENCKEGTFLDKNTAKHNVDETLINAKNFLTQTLEKAPAYKALKFPNHTNISLGYIERDHGFTSYENFDFSDDLPEKNRFYNYSKEFELAHKIFNDFEQAIQDDLQNFDAKNPTSDQVNKLKMLKKRLVALKFLSQKARASIHHQFKNKIYVSTQNSAEHIIQDGHRFVSQADDIKNTKIYVEQNKAYIKDHTFEVCNIANEANNLAEINNNYKQWHTLQRQFNVAAEKYNIFINNLFKFKGTNQGFGALLCIDNIGLFNALTYENIHPNFDQDIKKFTEKIEGKFHPNGEVYAKHVKTYSAVYAEPLISAIGELAQEYQMQLEKLNESILLQPDEAIGSIADTEKYFKTNEKMQIIQKMQKLSYLLSLLESKNSVSPNNCLITCDDIIKAIDRQIRNNQLGLIKEFMGGGQSTYQSDEELTRLKKVRQLIVDLKPEIDKKYPYYTRHAHTLYRQYTWGEVWESLTEKTYKHGKLVRRGPFERITITNPETKRTTEKWQLDKHSEFARACKRLYAEYAGRYKSEKKRLGKIISKIVNNEQIATKLTTDKINAEDSWWADTKDDSRNRKDNPWKMTEYEDPNKKPFKKPRKIQSTSRAIALSKDPFTAFHAAMQELAYDFAGSLEEKKQALSERIQAETDTMKRAGKVVQKGITKFGVKTFNGVKAVPATSKKVLATSLSLTKQGVIAGSKVMVKSGVYVMPKIASFAASNPMKWIGGYGFFVEGARTFAVFSQTGGNKLATSKHAAISGGFMVLSSETLYTMGAKSSNAHIANFSRTALGALRCAAPFFIAYGVYKLGTGQRLLAEGLPNFAARNPKIAKCWDYGILSDVTAAGAKGLAYVFSPIGVPISNSLIDNGAMTAYDPIEITPFDAQIEKYAECAKRNQKLIAKKQWFKNRLLSVYKDPTINDLLAKNFEHLWNKILFTSSSNLAYYFRDSNSKLKAVSLKSKQDYDYFQQGNEIYAYQMKARTESGETVQCYKLAMSGQLKENDAFGNRIRKEYLATQDQFNKLFASGRFNLIKVNDEKHLQELAQLDKGQSVEDFIHAHPEFRVFLKRAGIDPSLFDKTFKQKTGIHIGDKNVYLSNETSLTNHHKIEQGKRIKSYKATHGTNIGQIKSRLGQHKGRWLLLPELSIIQLDDAFVLSGDTLPKAVVSPENLIMDDPELKHILFLTENAALQYGKSAYGRMMASFKVECILRDSQDNILFKGNRSQAQAFANANPKYTITKMPEPGNKTTAGDLELINGTYTFLNPFYGFTSKETSYEDMLGRLKDTARLLVINRVKKGGKYLYSITHDATKEQLLEADSIDQLYDYINERKLHEKYDIIKPYHNMDKHHFKMQDSKVNLMRSVPGKGIIEHYMADPLEASDIQKGNVFQLSFIDKHHYQIKLQGKVIKSRLTFDQVDDYFAGYKSKAIIVFGSQNRYFWSKQGTKLEADFLESKTHQLSSNKIVPMSIQGSKSWIWWVNNDRRDQNPNQHAFFIRDYAGKKSYLTTDKAHVRNLLGEQGQMQEPVTKNQKLAYLDLYGVTYNDAFTKEEAPKRLTKVGKSKVYKDRSDTYHVLEQGSYPFK